MNSQSFYVGYAHPWVEPPAEVYDTASVRTFEGADITWQFNTADVAHSLNYYFGNSGVDSDLGGSSVRYDIHNLHGVNLSSTLGNLNTWLGYSNGDVGLNLDQVSVDFPATPTTPDYPVGSFSNYSLENDDAYFASVGFEYDNGDVLFTAEHVELDIKGWFPKSRSHYVTLGYHFGSWTPHLTWANSEDTTFDEVRGTNAAGQLLYNSVKTHQKSWTLGLRGDVAPGLAIKAEVSTFYDIGNADDGNDQPLRGDLDSGLFSGPLPDDKDNPMVFRLAANLVF
jgi:hypothetical protein